jgi:hypothetical protein
VGGISYNVLLRGLCAPTCFDSSLPSSGSFLDPSELLEIQIEWVVYRIMYGYVACVLECCGSVCCAPQLSSSRGIGDDFIRNFHISF